MTDGLLFTIDPRRVTDHHFGGPFFAAFEILPDGIVRCVRTGDLFDYGQMQQALSEGRNLAPIQRAAP